VTPEGKVKVLDFGLAKAYAGDQEVNLSNSPTLSDAATRQGVILGTAAYMSPEQARGKPVDKRTDIWAFGGVLFEMLTGQAAFQGEDVTEILAAVVKGGANLDLLPANIHPRVREVITRCLQKEQKKRYGGIGEAQYEIEKVLSDPSGVLIGPGMAVEPRRKLRTILPWAAATLVLGLIIAGVAVWKLKPTEPRQVMRFEYELPEGQQFTTINEQCNIAISPDGKYLAYNTNAGVYLRPMDELEAKLVPGTKDTEGVFFSPDSQWLAYYSESAAQLRKVSIHGGASAIIANTKLDGPPSWEEDDTILYSLVGKEIMRISAKGAVPEQIIKARDEIFVSPRMLPDRESVIFSNVLKPGKVMLQSLKTGERKELFSGTDAHYLPTGHIVYAIDDNLFVVPFDLDDLKVTGNFVSMVENVYRSAGPPQYDVSDSGTLIYVPWSVSGSESLPFSRSLVWVDRKGKEEPIAAPINAYQDLRISPDGTRAALTVLTRTTSDIWVWDFVRRTFTLLTSLDDNSDSDPLWAPDNKRVIFSEDRLERDDGIYWRPADGTGKTELVAIVPNLDIYPASWSDDGKSLVLWSGASSAVTSSDIGVLSTEGDHKYKPLLSGKYDEKHPMVSPDGRWLAYTSNESGKDEVYVRAFPEVDKGRWPISTNGGSGPLWSPDGRELFYRSGDAVMVVPLEIKPNFNPGVPKMLFHGTYVALGTDRSTLWDISPDGKRFLMMKSTDPVHRLAQAPAKSTSS
jgi:serine/threonine-protein kinase